MVRHTSISRARGRAARNEHRAVRQVGPGPAVQGLEIGEQQVGGEFDGGPRHVAVGDHRNGTMFGHVVDHAVVEVLTRHARRAAATGQEKEPRPPNVAARTEGGGVFRAVEPHLAEVDPGVPAAEIRRFAHDHAGRREPHAVFVTLNIVE